MHHVACKFSPLIFATSISIQSVLSSDDGETAANKNTLFGDKLFDVCKFLAKLQKKESVLCLWKKTAAENGIIRHS